MMTDHPLRQAFENVAGHIANLEEIQILVDKMVEERQSTTKCIQLLEEKMAEAEVTLVTDIRILINELHHISRER
ncbi:MAG: hypothetical protein ACFFF4_13215 [Candidatus Thorarchaeota archaeon]